MLGADVLGAVVLETAWPHPARARTMSSPIRRQSVTTPAYDKANRRRVTELRLGTAVGDDLDECRSNKLLDLRNWETRKVVRVPNRTSYELNEATVFGGWISAAPFGAQTLEPPDQEGQVRTRVR